MKLLEAPGHKVRQMNRDVLQKKLKEQNGDGRPKSSWRSSTELSAPPRQEGKNSQSGEFEVPQNPE
jgi:hypothetical protein